MWTMGVTLRTGLGVGETGGVLVGDGVLAISSVRVGSRAITGRGEGVRFAVGEALRGEMGTSPVGERTEVEAGVGPQEVSMTVRTSTNSSIVPPLLLIPSPSPVAYHPYGPVTTQDSSDPVAGCLESSPNTL